MNLFSLNNIKYISVILILLLILPPNLFVFIIPLLIFTFFLYRYNEQAIFFFVIVSYLTIVYEISVDLRNSINLLNFAILGIMFFYKYGFDFFNYPKINKNIFTFIILIICLMFLTSYINNSVIASSQHIFRVIIFMLICYFLFSFIKSNSQIILYKYAIIFSALIVSLIIIYNFLESGFALFYKDVYEFVRIGGLFSNINAGSGIFINSIPLLVALIFANFYKNNFIKRINIIVLVILFLGLLLTNSRAAILSTLIALYYMLFYINRKIFFYIPIVILSFILILSLTPFIEYINIYFRLERVMSGRETLWQIAMNIISQNWVFGTGPGMYKYHMYNNITVMLGTWEELGVNYFYHITDYGQAHNFYYFILAELGILGVILITFFVYSFYKICFKISKFYKNRNSLYYYTSIAIGGIGTGLLIRGLFEAIGIFSYGWITGDLPFWLMIFLLSYLHKGMCDSNILSTSK